MPLIPKNDVHASGESRWNSLRSSTQMFLVGTTVEALAIILLALGFWVSFSSPSTTLTVFLVCIVLGIIASTISSVLAIVGLFRYRRMTWWNALLLLASVIFNPILWFGLMALAS